MRKNVVATLLGLSLCSFAYAQDSIRTTQLHELLVSASRTEQPILEVPRNVSVLTREEIQNSNYLSVGDLLARQAGIFIIGANQTPGTNQSIFMRGANSNQTAILVDGIRITDPSTPNATIDLSELSLTNIERIEIVRGSHSTLYGGSAMGGVVNIITANKRKQGLSGDVSTQATTFGSNTSSFTESVNLNYSFANGWYVNASGQQQNTNGLDATPTSPEAVSGTFESNDRDDFRKTDGVIKAGYQNKKWDGFISYKKADQKADIDNGSFSDDDNNTLNFVRNFLNYRMEYAVNDRWSLTALGAISSSERISENDSSVVDADGNYDRSYSLGKYKGKVQTYEVQSNFDYNRLEGVIGAGQYGEDMSFNTYFFSNAFGFPFESKVNYDSIETSATTHYLFGKGSYSIHKFNIATGFRFTNHSRVGTFWSFEVNPSYQLKNALLFASISSGYNVPSLYQLFDPSQEIGYFTTRGNKNLKAEESLSFEVGIKKEFSSGDFITFSAFNTTVKNSIEYIYLWNSGKAIDALDFSDYRGDTYINIAEQTVSGAEVSTYFFVHPKLSIGTNLTLLTGSVTANPSDAGVDEVGDSYIQLFNFGSFLTSNFENKKLTRRPSASGNASLGYKPTEEVLLTVRYQYAGSRYDVGYDSTKGPFGALSQTNVDAYGLIDATVNWQVTKAFTLQLSTENLFDKDYYEINGFQTRGRSVSGKVTIKW